MGYKYSEIATEDLLSMFQDQKGIHNFELESGVRKFEKILKALSPQYRNLQDFFADNTGATEAVLAWICENPPIDWRENLASEINQKTLDEHCEDAGIEFEKDEDYEEDVDEQGEAEQAGGYDTEDEAVLN